MNRARRLVACSQGTARPGLARVGGGMSGYGGSEAPAAAGMVGGGDGGADAHRSSAKSLEGDAKRGTPHQGLLKLERARTLLGEPQDSSMENVGLRCALCFWQSSRFPDRFSF